MTAPQQHDVAGTVLAIDQAMIALAVAKSALLGETSAPMAIPLASLRDRGHYDAGSAAEVAECGLTIDAINRSFTCERPVSHSGPHAASQGPGVPPVEWVKIADPPAAEPFPHLPHLAEHQGGRPDCIVCGIDHDAAARLAPPAGYGLPSIEKTGGAS